MLLFLFSFSFHTASAAISACSVTVDPTTVSGGTSASLIFNITNNDQDSNLLYWVKVIAPTSDFTLTSGDGPSLGGVTISDDHSSVVINTTLSGGETGAFTIGVTAGNNGVSASAFTVLASAASAGDEPTTCTGDSSVSISGNTQAILTISDVKVSTNDTAATLSWTTGGNTTGIVDYGTSTAYGSQATHTTLGTSHSVSLTGLSASTTYHFRITSTDGSQNSVQSSDNNFVTGSVGATVETTTTITTTTVKNVIQIQEVKDTTPPSVSITSELKGVYSSAPEIAGKAIDDGGIAEVLYSVDDGKNWLHVNIGTIGAKKVNFAFTPEVHEDGNYVIRTKAIDSSGNEKVSTPVTLIIDRLPPLASGAVFSIGPQILTPLQSGTVTVLSGMSPKLTFSAVGGPTSIIIRGGDHNFTATKNTENGLWSTTITISESGTYKLIAHETDGAENVTDQELSGITVVPTGVVRLNDAPVVGAELSVYFYNPQTLSFLLWDGKEYGQDNPQQVENGSYKLLLPPGTYFIKVTSPNARNLQSEIFSLDTTEPITTNLTLYEKQSIRFGSLHFVLPNFLQNDTSAAITFSKEDQSETNVLIGHEFPYFKFGSLDSNTLRGKPSLVTILSSWHPQTVEELSTLDKLYKLNLRVVAVVTQESEKSVEIFRQRGGFSVPIVADTDGVLILPLKLTSIPTHYFMDRRGIVRAVRTGLLGTDEIETVMSNFIVSF
jgi:hypothetical protein